MKTIFINISNHPTDTWSDAQKAAVKKQYGPDEIRDIQFPNVNPEWSTKDVSVLVRTYENSILKIKENCDDPDVKLIVHVMGEMVFTQQLICALSVYRAITCIASTTKREIVTKFDENGIEVGKESKFIFCRFREYYY